MFRTGKYFYVTVVVDGRLTVGFQMERVDHVDVVQICGCRLICEVDRMLQRQIQQIGNVSNLAYPAWIPRLCS